MLAQIKSEWENGKKIYIFEIVSIIGFILFLTISNKVTILSTTMLGNYISLGWILINTLVILIYVFREFVKVLMKEKGVKGNIIHEIFIRTLFFIILFMINIFPITILLMFAGAKIGVDVSIPFFAVAIGLFITCMARKSIPSPIALTVVGITWFITSFTVVFFTYPLFYALIVSFIKQEIVASTILSIILFSMGLGVFSQVIKRVKSMLEGK